MKDKTKKTKKTIKQIMKKQFLNYKIITYTRCIKEIVGVLKNDDNIYLDDFIKIKIKKVKPRTIYSNLPNQKKIVRLNKTEKIYIHPTKEFEKLILNARKNKTTLDI
jgi:hypothetical protein